MLQQRTKSYFGSYMESELIIPSQNSPEPRKAGNAQAAGRTVLKFDQPMVVKELNALSSLLEDRFEKAVSWIWVG